MKKYIAFALTCAFLCISADICGAQYVSLHLGTDYGHLTNKSNTGNQVGFKTGASYGYVFGSGVRGEFEWTYRNNPFKTTTTALPGDEKEGKTKRTISSHSYMTNIYYDVNQLTWNALTPYVGIGVGYSQHSDELKYKDLQESKTNTKHDNGFVYQGIAGIKYNLNETLDLMTSYHFFQGRDHQKNHSVSMSLARNF